MIESVNNDRVKNWNKLNDKKFQDIENKFLVEGEHLVEEAQKSGNLIEVISLDGYDFGYENTTYVSEPVMKKISTLVNAPRVIGVCSKIKPHGIDGNVLLLDRISDPGNLGTIIRSAVAFDIDTIILGDGTVSVYNPKVVRASEGMMFHINIIEANLQDAITELKDMGYKVYATDVENGTSLKSIEFPSKCAILMGNEGSGVDPSIKDLADENLYIDMNDSCESLNVGVATSIILYELNK